MIAVRKKISVTFLTLTLALGLTNSLVIPSQVVASENATRVAKQSRPSKLSSEVKQQLSKGDDFMGKAKFADAAACYHQALNKDPKCLGAMLGYGFALAKQFKLDGANEEFEKALAIDPGNPVALAGKAMADYNRLQSSSTTVQKNRDAILRHAENDVRQGLSKDPNMPEARYTLGCIYKEEGQLTEALEQYLAATQLDTTYGEAFSGAGMAQLNLGQNQQAIDSLRTAIKLNAINPTAHYGLGRALLKDGQAAEAVSELTASLSQYPNSAPAHFSLGEAYVATGNVPSALREFEESIHLKPNNLEPYLSIATVYEKEGDFEKANAELQEAAKLFTKNTDLVARIADNWLKLEKLDDAMSDYKAVLEADPKTPAAALAAKGLARACYLRALRLASSDFFSSDEFTTAMHDIEEASKANPSDIEVRFALAKMRTLAGTPIDLESVGTIHNDAERLALAEALLAQTKYSDESAQFEQVIANANDGDYLLSLGNLALLIKDLPTAREAYEKAGKIAEFGERAKHALEAVSKQKDLAHHDLTEAKDLFNRGQIASSLDKYRAAIYDDQKSPAGHLDYAQTLEKITPPYSKDKRESLIQYREYKSLSPQMNAKDGSKLDGKLQMLERRAARLEAKEKSQHPKI